MRTTSLGSVSFPASDADRPRALGPIRLGREPRDEGMELAAGATAYLGSGPRAVLRFHEPDVAPLHCAVTHRGDAIEVRDLGSASGVFYFGARVPSAILHPPAVVGLGARGATLRIVASQASNGSSFETLPGLVGNAPVMHALAQTVQRLARVALPVLLRGESGVGKELVARALHTEGPRARGPFVVLNAATISKELAESELFGHVRGAFTGATGDRRGAFREAHGGTLFLDEIGSLSLELQAKLLRVVEDGVTAPVGGDARTPTDVRLVVATCEPLEHMVEERRFRADLYERLAVCVVQVPPLRERRHDIPAIATCLLARAGFQAALTPRALELLCDQPFRGNVRELRNILVQSALHRGENAIDAEDVRAILAVRGAIVPRMSPTEAAQLVARCDGRIAPAARVAGMARTTFRDLLRRERSVRRRGQKRPPTPA